MLSPGMQPLLKCDDSMNFLLQWVAVRQPVSQPGEKLWQIPGQLLWTFNYSLSYKMEDPSVLCNYVLYLARSPEFYLITHYVGTIVNCCLLCLGSI